MSTALRAAQKSRAQSLYRRSLKHCLSWAVNRELFWSEAEKIRAEFEKHKDADQFEAERLLERGERLLARRSHPDPYKVPYRPGGTLYARNPPVSPLLHQEYDFGREAN